jgi:hypothetical protein
MLPACRTQGEGFTIPQLELTAREVEEIARVFPVQPRAPFIAGDRLIGGKIHLAAFGGVPFDLGLNIEKLL